MIEAHCYGFKWQRWCRAFHVAKMNESNKLWLYIVSTSPMILSVLYQTKTFMVKTSYNHSLFLSFILLREMLDIASDMEGICVCVLYDCYCIGSVAIHCRSILSEPCWPAGLLCSGPCEDGETCANNVLKDVLPTVVYPIVDMVQASLTCALQNWSLMWSAAQLLTYRSLM